ncbi:hypothetical protein MDR57_003663 [Salmonella enterica]|nr:hypothetical protein [Salmonella enterica]
MKTKTIYRIIITWLADSLDGEQIPDDKIIRAKKALMVNADNAGGGSYFPSVTPRDSYCSLWSLNSTVNTGDLSLSEKGS